MQQLAPPYEFYQVPTEPDDADLVTPAVLLELLAPVTGESFQLAASPFAIDQLYLQGAGGWIRPRTQKLLAPARCKLLKVSPCRRLWTFAISKSLRMHVQVKVACELPVAHQLIAPGTLLQVGQPFATISASALKHQPMVVCTLQQVKSTTPLAISWQSGQLSAGEDSMMKLHRIPAYQADSELSTPSSPLTE